MIISSRKNIGTSLLVLAFLLCISSCFPTNETQKQQKLIGWREWASLPELGIKKIKLKVDTGAKTSSMHATDIEKVMRGKDEFIRFKVHSNQVDPAEFVIGTSKLLEYREIKSSNGQVQLRPVILTQIKLLGEIWPIEVTLTNREEMGFKMLLGRSGIKSGITVDPKKSFLSNP